MPNSPSLIVYLDSSILTAWLKNEERPGDEMDGVYECFERIQKWEIQAIVSSLYLAEIDVEQYSRERQVEFFRLFSERNPYEVGIDSRVCKLAGEIRWHFRKQGKRIETPDALHLAAAIHHDATEFYVFDDGVEGKRISLLDLSGDLVGHSLAIRKPPVIRPRLNLGKKRSGESEETTE